MTLIHTYIHVCMYVCTVCMYVLYVCMYVLYVCMYVCMYGGDSPEVERLCDIGVLLNMERGDSPIEVERMCDIGVAY